MNVALRTEHLNLISICTGGFGLDLGVELAIPSARTVCMVEREAFAVAQLVSAMEAGNMAPAPIWSDARTFNGRAWRGAVDGLIGGIPCQPHSLAGRKQGQNDERDLWSDARRIIVQSGAWFVLIENVSGMLSAGSDEIAGAERVCRDLHKLGFSVEGGLFTASEIGAPHQRERVFILAVADSNGEHDDGPWVKRPRRRGKSSDRSSELADALGQRGCSRNSGWKDAADVDAASEAGLPSLDNTFSERWGEGRIDHPADERHELSAASQYDLADAQSRQQRGAWKRQAGPGPDQLQAGRYSSRLPIFPPGPSDADGWREVLSRVPELEPAFRRVADGLASRLDIARVDRLRMLGNGVVPLEAAYALRTLITRLAARGSSRAVKLMGMMEGTEA